MPAAVFRVRLEGNILNKNMKIFPFKKSRLHIELTGRCNLKCSYCFQSGWNTPEKTKKELGTEEVKDLIRQGKKFGCKVVTITGGEPFVRPDIWEILDFCKELKVEILTNSEMLGVSEIINIGEKYPQVQVVKISIDGFWGHEKNRFPSTHKKIIENFKLFKKYTKAKLIANTVVTKHSISDLEKLYGILKNVPVDTWRIDLPFLAGRYEKNVKNYNLSPEDAIKNLKQLLIKYFKDKKPFAVEIFNLYKSEMVTDKLFKFNVDIHPCSYSRWRTLCVKPNGDIVFCPSLLMPLANVMTKKGVDVGSAIKKARKNKFFGIKVRNIKDCVSCRYLNICGSGCRADALYWSKDMKKPDPVACKYMKLMESEIMPILPKKEREYLRALIKK